MSLPFSNTTTKKGIIQRLERVIYGMDADARISGNSTLLAQWTAEVNLALDKALAIIFQADGRWQFDDSNHTDYPTITTATVASQRDYSFTSDENSNLILEIHKVYVQGNGSTVYDMMTPADETETWNFFDGTNSTGNPVQYGLKANAILLDPIPDYAQANAIKVEISREGSYFTTSDTTKTPGFAGIFHDYLVIEPAYRYAYQNNLANVGLLRDEMLRMEEAIKDFYGKRNPDDRPIIRPKKILYK